MLWFWGVFLLFFFFSNGSQTLNSYLNFIKIKWYWWTNRSVLFKLVLSCWTSLLTALQFKLIFWVLRHLLVLETFKWTLTHGAFVQHSHNLTPFRATIIHWITGSVVWKEGMRLKKCTLNTLLSTFTLYNKSKQKQRLVHFATMTLTSSELKVLDTRRATRFGVVFFVFFSLKL